MAGDWEQAKPDKHLIQFYEAIKPKESEHQVTFIDPIFPNTHRLECTCGAKWSINEKEFEANDLKIDWHRSYAKRSATRVD